MPGRSSAAREGGAALDRARAIVEAGVRARIYPAAVFEVGRASGAFDQHACGTRSFDAGEPPADGETIFDLSSLTKPIATTSVILALTIEGKIQLEDPVSAFFPEWQGADRESVTLRDLLEHASGLAARLVDAPPGGRHEFEHEICTMRLEYEPRSRSVYSDLGFILLGFLAEDRGCAPLDVQFAALAERTWVSSPSPRLPFESSDTSIAFTVPPAERHRAAPTVPLGEDVRRGRRLVGEVHDNYAAVLGGTAGHAGLFGTAGGVGTFARLILRAARGDTQVPPPFITPIVRRATSRSLVPGSSRALGWDTMLPTSSCGTRMSAAAFGHVGFTGTSLWIDPARDRYFVLLTNRACGGGTLAEMREVRRAFHDALGDA
jgi:CubicO group peptidase (beta-lactamase class C family)